MFPFSGVRRLSGCSVRRCPTVAGDCSSNPTAGGIFQIFDGIGIVFGAFVNVGMLLQAFLGQLVSVGMGLLILFVQYVLADVGYQ